VLATTVPSREGITVRVKFSHSAGERRLCGHRGPRREPAADRVGGAQRAGGGTLKGSGSAAEEAPSPRPGRVVVDLAVTGEVLVVDGGLAA
jgi:hypothetical protein